MAFKPPHGALGNAKNNPKNHQRSKMTQTRAETARSTQFFSSLLGSALAGSDRPLIVSAGIGPLAPGRPATEDDDPRAHSAMPRVSEQSAMALRSQGVRVAVVRLPQVHNTV